MKKTEQYLRDSVDNMPQADFPLRPEAYISGVENVGDLMKLPSKRYWRSVAALAGLAAVMVLLTVSYEARWPGPVWSFLGAVDPVSEVPAVTESETPQPTQSEEPDVSVTGQFQLELDPSKQLLYTLDVDDDGSMERIALGYQESRFNIEIFNELGESVYSTQQNHPEYSYAAFYLYWRDGKPYCIKLEYDKGRSRFYHYYEYDLSVAVKGGYQPNDIIANEGFLYLHNDAFGGLPVRVTIDFEEAQRFVDRLNERLADSIELFHVYNNEGIHTPNLVIGEQTEPQDNSLMLYDGANEGASVQEQMDAYLASVGGMYGDSAEALKDRVMANMPDLKRESLESFMRWSNMDGYCTSADTPSLVTIFRYTEESNSVRMILMLDTEGETTITQLVNDTYVGMYPSTVDILDLTGDGRDEIIICMDSGGSGGSFYMLVYTVSDGKLQMILNNTDSNFTDPGLPERIDLGFSGETLSDYRVRMSNRYTGTDYEIDISHLKYFLTLDNIVDENGKGRFDVMIDPFTGYAFTDVTGDGIPEIRVVNTIWYYTHVETIGYATAYLSYDKATGAFQVNRTEYTTEVGDWVYDIESYIMG